MSSDGEGGLPVGVVVIGRNEGERLRRCLGSLRSLAHVVYVDSGSSDGSRELARQLGASVVSLSTPPGFSAARARNAGLLQLLDEVPDLAFVQFVDGDCTVAEEWLAAAMAAMETLPKTAMVFGRRREQFAGANAYHRACDREWDVAAGEVDACGGDVLARVSALGSVGMYNPALIAGEEPDLCLRLRRTGWSIRCIATPMTTHDVAIASFGQWWRRSRRAGFATMQLVRLHGANATPGWRRYILSTGLWAGLITLAVVCAITALLANSATLALVSAILAVAVVIQVLRLAARIPGAKRRPLQAVIDAALVLVTKFASLAGIAEFWLKQLGRRDHTLIEYKDSKAS